MVNTIEVQYLTDANGKQTAVQIPIETWKEIRTHLPNYLKLLAIENSLRQGFKEVKEMQEGKKPKKTLSEFLKELE